MMMQVCMPYDGYWKDKYNKISWGYFSLKKLMATTIAR